MSEHHPQEELFARLEFLLAAARARLSGAELAIVVHVTLEQSVSARELDLTRQGYKRARDAVVQRGILCCDGKELQPNPEACAKFGIARIESDDTGVDLLRKLADGSLEPMASKKNLYQCNADGMPASDDEQNTLFENLKDAVIMFASAELRARGQNIPMGNIFPQGVSREMQMRGMASIVSGFLSGRLSKAWPGTLETAMSLAIRSVRPEYPRVLDPHHLLNRFREFLRDCRDNTSAKLGSARKGVGSQGTQAVAEQEGEDGAAGDSPLVSEAAD